MALASYWTVIDPLGDCTVDTVAGELSIAIPSGVTHDLGTANKNAVRVLQNAQNVDFTVTVKVTSTLTTNTQNIGIVAELDINNMAMVKLNFSSGVLKAFIGNMNAGTLNQISSVTLTSPTYPIWIRIQRVVNDWTMFTSYDGTTFTQRGSIMTYTINVAKVGLFAGNTGGNPALTATLDDFFADGTDYAALNPARIDSLYVLDYFSAIATAISSAYESLAITDSFSARLIDPGADSISFDSSFKITDRFSARVITQNQLNWTVQPSASDVWTDKPISNEGTL